MQVPWKYCASGDTSLGFSPAEHRNYWRIDATICKAAMTSEALEASPHLKLMTGAPVSDPFRAVVQDGRRGLRVSRYRNWSIQRKLAELSAQVEAAVLEVRAAVVHKHCCQWMSSGDECLAVYDVGI